MKISLHVERLILEGVASRRPDRAVVGAAVQKELTRLLQAGGLAHEFQSGGAIPNIAGGGISLREKAHPTDVGRQIASAVYRGIGQRR
jgi:hypothetical protein